MPSFASSPGNVLYVIVCAAPPAQTATTALVQVAQQAGWDVSVVATPAAHAWLPSGLAEMTGHPVRTEVRRPDEASYEPLANAVLVAPATFNTVNRWAAGINDTLALGLLNEALGYRVPVAVLPWLNEALRAHPVYERNVGLLRAAGVHFASVDSAQDSDVIAAAAIDALRRVASPQPPR